MRYTIILLFVLVLFTACNNLGNERVLQQIAGQNRKLHEVVKRKNIDLLDEVYHPDAYFLPPGDSVVQGIENIKAKWLSGLDVMEEMHSRTLMTVGQGDIVSETGIVETRIRTKDTAFVYKAKYNNVWQKDASGKYLLRVDIWNAIIN